MRTKDKRDYNVGRWSSGRRDENVLQTQGVDQAGEKREKKNRMRDTRQDNEEADAFMRYRETRQRTRIDRRIHTEGSYDKQNRT